MEHAVEEKRKTELLEALAKLEHKQWRTWALAIIDTEEISEARSERWRKIINKEWHELSEEEKFKDVEWAEQVLWIVKKYLGIK